MEIRVLKYFLMVAREESITKAASRLHITQPTLSRQQKIWKAPSAWQEGISRRHVISCVSLRNSRHSILLYISAITRTSRLTFVNVWIMAASMWASLCSLSIGRSMSHSPSENRAGWGCICVRMIRSPRSRKYGCKTWKAAPCCGGFVQILMRCSLPGIRIRIAILP